MAGDERPGAEVLLLPSAAAAARGWGRLAGEVADGVVARTVHHTHRAVAGRVFDLLGPVGGPARLAHHAISEGVHRIVRTSLRSAAHAGGALAGALMPDDAVPWHERSTVASRLAAVANGLLGDLAEVAPPLRLPLAIREGGRTVPATGPALRAAFPRATGRLAVFVHGLVEDESIWDGGRRSGLCGLPAALAEQGYTPIRVRYGTGERIAANGAALDRLLTTLVDGWPAPVDELVLVGHSMGGLVIRAACGRAAADDRPWLPPLSHAVYLGSPHLGAPLEQAVHRLVTTVGRVPELAPLLAILERRSAGIRDLRHGTLDDAEVDLMDDLATMADDPWLDGVTHHLVVGRLARSTRHPINRVAGDLLVTAASARGRSRRRRIEGGRVQVLEVPANHFALCWHPEVVDHLRRHLATGADAAAG
jgi:hypothetical protein